MNYEVEMTINLDLEKVFELYTTEKHFKKWELGLNRIESNQKNIFKEGAHSVLVFKQNEQEFKMNMKIHKITAPDLLVVSYEVPGAYNLCKNYFYKENQHTKWIMNVEFEFDQDVDVPLESFISKTKAGMEIFKIYAENNKRKR